MKTIAMIEFTGGGADQLKAKKSIYSFRGSYNLGNYWNCGVDDIASNNSTESEESGSNPSEADIQPVISGNKYGTGSIRRYEELGCE